MKTVVSFFVSYAQKNRKRADAFLERLNEQMRPSKSYDFRPWRDSHILVGEDWDAEIHSALDACHFGLLLVSPVFLVRDYIRREELPRFVGIAAKPVVPVLLEPVDAERHDLLGLESRQIYAWNGPRVRMAFSECSTDQHKSQFVRELYQQIERRLDKINESGNA